MQPSKPLIMAVLNVTPDSFSDGGQHVNLDDAVAGAKRMVDQGADIIDVGGESTRPGACAVSEADEINRVIPVIQTLSAELTTPISIDTSKPQVMKQAVAAGASLINDVNALQADGALEMAASLGVDVCLMHMKGSPRTMQKNPTYNNVIEEIKQFFQQRIDACLSAGIAKENIILDPGFGFGKTLEHNLEILRCFDEFKCFGVRLLAGLSRKSMIGAILNNREVKGRVVGSVTGAIIAVQNGANIVRVHDVLETKDALLVMQAAMGEGIG
ncbi:MAG: dihydropteroate synthase [Candidatus Thioglobus sp.]|uniref:dihydropteroate synthase n=1 Tax=Candidatus Thioglobus sp. TaxID=2026721 RepID=UPI002623E570|nr:dihydropteroate synthase [Candidatus Thioglobus sp.]MDC9726925.1 dihydropteroate synthase [Candidatus Thioglobus sp.]